MERATDESSRPSIQYIDLPYTHKESENSLKELVYRIQPKWRDTPEHIQIVQFKDGITNTVSLNGREARALC